MRYLYILFAILLASCDKQEQAQEPQRIQSALTEPQTTSSPTSNKTVSKGVIASVTDVTVYGELSEQVMQQLVKEETT